MTPVSGPLMTSGGLAGGRHTSDIGFSSVTCDTGIS